MDFNNKAPDWSAPGVEPPASLKEQGFEAGYKPPASFFNWFWTRVSSCLSELQNKLSGHADSKSNPHGVTAAQIGLGKVNNTADSEKQVASANRATSAGKVDKSMVVRFNGGASEGTSMWIFNGSASKDVNITATKIGAADTTLSNVSSETLAAKLADAGGSGAPIVAAASTDGVTYTATVKGVTELKNGLTIVIVPNIASTSTEITLNVNSLGAKTVRIPLSFNTAAMTSPGSASFFAAGRPVTLQYDSAYANIGTWKTVDKQRASAQDLYGIVPIASGGTGAETAAAAREALGVTLENLGDIIISETTPATVADGKWYLIKSEV